MANAGPLLEQILRAMRETHIEGILIGNSAVAIQGAPVTTDDFDFYFRATPQNLKKLSQMAAKLQAPLTQPHYPLSHLYRMKNLDAGIQVDMMASLTGVRSYESVRSRATRSQVAGESIWVASLEDVIKMKRSANRPKDLAVLPVLEQTLAEKKLLDAEKKA